MFQKLVDSGRIVLRFPAHLCLLCITLLLSVIDKTHERNTAIVSTENMIAFAPLVYFVFDMPKIYNGDRFLKEMGRLPT